MLDDETGLTLLLAATALLTVVWLVLKLLTRRRSPRVHKRAGSDGETKT